MTVASTFRYLTHHPLYTTGSGTPLHGPISVSVVDSGRETPGPIPNPEAKPARADGTALGRVWESKLPPTQQLQNNKQPACHTRGRRAAFRVFVPPNPARRYATHPYKTPGRMCTHTAGNNISTSSEYVAWGVSPGNDGRETGPTAHQISAWHAPGKHLLADNENKLPYPLVECVDTRPALRYLLAAVSVRTSSVILFGAVRVLS